MSNKMCTCGAQMLADMHSKDAAHWYRQCWKVAKERDEARKLAEEIRAYFADKGYEIVGPLPWEEKEKVKPC